MKITSKEFIENLVNEMFEMDYCQRQVEYMLRNITENDVVEQIDKGLTPCQYAIIIKENFEGGLWS